MGYMDHLRCPGGLITLPHYPTLYPKTLCVVKAGMDRMMCCKHLQTLTLVSDNPHLWW